MIKLVALAAGMLASVGPMMGPNHAGSGIPENAIVTEDEAPVITQADEFIVTDETAE